MLTTGDREELASAALARVDALHTGLTQIVLEGGNLDGIAAEVARVLGVGVVFMSTDGRERAAALGADHRALLADQFDRVARDELRTPVVEVMPLTDVAAAHARLDAGLSGRKLVLAMY